MLTSTTRLQTKEFSNPQNKQEIAFFIDFFLLSTVCINFINLLIKKALFFSLSKAF